MALQNNVPRILKSQSLTISDLQRRTGLSYPAVHNIATAEQISDKTQVGTLRKISKALGVSIGDLVTEAN